MAPQIAESKQTAPADQPASFQLRGKKQLKNTVNRRPLFDFVPNEVIHEISALVDLKSLCALSRTSRRIGGIINKNKFRHPCRRRVDKVHFDLVNNVVTINNPTSRCVGAKVASFPSDCGPLENKKQKPYCFSGKVLPTIPDINRQIKFSNHFEPDVQYYLRQERIRNTEVRPKGKNAMDLLDIFESGWHLIPTNITLDPCYLVEHQALIDKMPTEWKQSVTGIEYRKGTKHVNLFDFASVLKSLENVKIEEGCCFTGNNHYTRIVNNMTNLKSIVDNRDRGWTFGGSLPILSDDSTLEALINTSKKSPLHQFWIHASASSYSFGMIKRFLEETNFANIDEVFLFHLSEVRGASLQMIHAWLKNTVVSCNKENFNKSQQRMVNEYQKSFKFQYNNRAFTFFFSRFPDFEPNSPQLPTWPPMLWTSGTRKTIHEARKYTNIMRNI